MSWMWNMSSSTRLKHVKTCKSKVSLICYSFRLALLLTCRYEDEIPRRAFSNFLQCSEIYIYIVYICILILMYYSPNGVKRFSFVCMFMFFPVFSGFLENHELPKCFAFCLIDLTVFHLPSKLSNGLTCNSRWTWAEEKTSYWSHHRHS